MATVREQIMNAFTWAKSYIVRKSDVVNSTAGTATNLPCSAAVAKDLQTQINSLNTNTHYIFVGTATGDHGVDISKVPFGAELLIQVRATISSNTSVQAEFSFDAHKEHTSTGMLHLLGYYYSPSFYATIPIVISETGVAVETTWYKIEGAGTIPLNDNNLFFNVYQKTSIVGVD